MEILNLYKKYKVGTMLSKKEIMECGIPKGRVRELLDLKVLTKKKNRGYILMPEMDMINEYLKSFYKFVVSEDYASALEILNTLYTYETVYTVSDYNFYLYLLSTITVLDGDMAKYAFSLKPEHIAVLEFDKRFSNPSLENEIRFHSFAKNYITFTNYYDNVDTNGLKTCEIIHKNICKNLIDKANMVVLREFL